ncbi:hypothetical protein EDC62_2043 [Tibeticola sediminis]|uniref:Uncharacterized protein n=1 Tax=Tibeticola sediminis TaxID=1917811 RepID=A0A3N4UCL6_9BURK|nr:hypothetical protein [Tibeticola sediminis]RPE64921.1 hypothetical protein EDC62_2043 [Tibeticola sediminis]
MDVLLLLLLAGAGLQLVNRQQQRTRVQLLAESFAPLDIQRLTETLLRGYLSALDLPVGEPRETRWRQLIPLEQALAERLSQFAAAFGARSATETRVSTLPLALPAAHRWWPTASFDLRRAFDIHARGLQRALQVDGGAPTRDRAYTLMAELLLLQFSCHWFCRSRAVATARLVALHQTTPAEVLAAVTPATREDYLALTGLRIA